MSLPSRERGLKSADNLSFSPYILVAPLAGAWIEICRLEIFGIRFDRSLPSRERGLKFLQCC